MRGPLRVAALAGVIATAACTSLLGDFMAGTGGQPDATAPGDASSEAAEPGPPDAGTDASKGGEAGSAQLSCTTWRWTQPIVVEDLSAGPTRSFLSKYALFPGDVDQLRIVAAKNGSPAFSVYTVTKASMQVQQLDAPVLDGGNSLPFVHGIHHVSSAIGGTTAVAVGQHSPSDAGNVTGFSVTAFSDLMPAAGPLPQPFALLAPIPTPSLNDLSIVPFSTTDVFEAVSIGAGSPPTYTLGVARVSPTTPSSAQTLATIATSSNAGDFSSMRLLHTNGNVYVYDINDLATPGCSAWTVPETAVVTAMPAKQVVAAGFSAGVIGLSLNGSMPAADFLLLEEDFSGQFTSGYKYYVGTVGFAALSSWMTPSLTQLRRPTSAFAAPLFNASPAFNVVPWFNDNAMMLGPGLRNGVTDAAPAPGLNLLWINSSGAIRADQTGPSQILNDRSDFVWAGAVPARITATSADWDVVWVETITPDAGPSYDVLRMNELHCQ